MTNKSSDELLNQDPREAYQQADEQPSRQKQPSGSMVPPEYQQGAENKGNQPTDPGHPQNRMQPKQQSQQQQQQSEGQQPEQFGDVDMPDMEFQSDKLEESDPEKQIQEADDKIDELENSPEQQYKDRLEANDVSLGEAERIIDQVILREKPYFEKFDIYKGLEGVFRTRSEINVQNVYQQLEAAGPDYQLTQSNILARWNLASALAAYGNQTFGSSPEDITETAHFISNLNYRVVQLLTRKYQEFDRKLNLVFSDGYLDVF